MKNLNQLQTIASMIESVYANEDPDFLDILPYMIDETLYEIVHTQSQELYEIEQYIPWGYNDMTPGIRGEFDGTFVNINRYYSPSKNFLKLLETNDEYELEELVYQIYRAFETMAHEMRHAWQYINNPEILTLECPKDMDAFIWYSINPAEVDAREYQQIWHEEYIDEFLELAIDKLMNKYFFN